MSLVQPATNKSLERVTMNEFDGRIFLMLEHVKVSVCILCCIQKTALCRWGSYCSPCPCPSFLDRWLFNRPVGRFATILTNTNSDLHIRFNELLSSDLLRILQGLLDWGALGRPVGTLWWKLNRVPSHLRFAEYFTRQHAAWQANGNVGELHLISPDAIDKQYWKTCTQGISPQPIFLRKGDVFLTHWMLLHSGSKNYQDDIRHTLFFRLISSNHHLRIFIEHVA
eukprot:g69099.t1